MPKLNRFADTVFFIRGLTDPNGMAVGPAVAVADLLDSFNGTIPAAVDAAMSQGRRGTELTRKYRRAMILILCVLNNTLPSQAKQAVDMIPDSNLHASLVTMLRDVQTIYGRRVLTPLVDQLKANPLQFLTNHRIKIGRGAMTTSGPALYDFSWDALNRLYYLEPANPHQQYVHTKVQGFNIHVQKYSDVKDELHNIQGAVVTGDLALTTQLSGCTVIYKVNGGTLTVAHVQPDAQVKNHVPRDLAQYAGAPVGVLQTLRFARDANLGGAQGTLGFFGMVSSPAETNMRLVGQRNVRVHGYSDQLGNAYFLGVKSGGTWQLFAQQNNPRIPNGGVTKVMQLYP
jgi:hypothetical protein